MLKSPWRWSEDGLQLIDAEGRSVLKIRPSDATEEEFNAIQLTPQLVEFCRSVVAYSKETSNCYICGEDDHSADCPALHAAELLDSVSETAD